MLCEFLGMCAVAASLTGPAHVHDGDTIRIHGVSVRLQGVDAEELTERHGDAARAALSRIIAGRPVRCVPEGQSYNRIVATCYLPDGRDIGAELIKSGLALDCARYSRGKYRSLEPPASRQRLTQKVYCSDR